MSIRRSRSFSSTRPWIWIRHHRKAVLTGLLLLSHVLGGITSLVAIMKTRTSQGAIAWAISLNTIPYVAVPAYWVFGRSKFEDYHMERQAAFEATNPVAALIENRYLTAGLVANPDRDNPLLLEKLARLPFTSFNSVELLVDGQQTFESIFRGIEQAQDYILVQYYIVRDDKLGRELRDRLAAKAKQGIRVFFLYDQLGSSGLPDSYVQSLRAAGVQVGPFNSTKGKANRMQINFRNHRKVVVVDGKEAWTGGLNVGDEYMSGSTPSTHWRDTHVKTTGPAALFAQLSFAEDWRWATGELPQVAWQPYKATSGSQEVLVLPSGPADTFETCTLFFLDTINRAQHRLWIATPYFVPDVQVMSALQLAALRGVDVRVIVPARNDSQVVEWAMLSYLAECERAGIKTFEYTKGFMHQKVVLVDNDTAAVGTANFDNRSFRLNFEITAIVEDTSFAQQVEQMLEGDLANSRPKPATDVTSASLPFRVLVQTTRLLAPVL